MIEIKKILADIRKKEKLYYRTTNPEKDNRRVIEFLTELLQSDHPIDNKDWIFFLKIIRIRKNFLSSNLICFENFHLSLKRFLIVQSVTFTL
jgi:hypothetical protein